MFGRKARPVINNLITGAASASGYKPDVVTSPKSPLEFIKIQSPRVFNNYVYGGAVGVGLGIVAALEKNIDTSSSCLQTQALCNKSVPISVSSVRNRGNAEETLPDGESLEDYTYVTCHEPNKKSHTRVYYDACQNSSHRITSKNHRASVFHICPETSSSTVESSARSDFLSSCHMCHKKLHGEDIYMYRGEKAYCSTECRERQIVMDEKKPTCQVSSRSTVADLSTSPCTTHDRQMFTTGIFAI